MSAAGVQGDGERLGGRGVVRSRGGELAVDGDGIRLPAQRDESHDMLRSELRVHPALRAERRDGGQGHCRPARRVVVARKYQRGAGVRCRCRDRALQHRLGFAPPAGREQQLAERRQRGRPGGIHLERTPEQCLGARRIAEGKLRPGEQTLRLGEGGIGGDDRLETILRGAKLAGLKLGADGAHRLEDGSRNAHWKSTPGSRELPAILARGGRWGKSPLTSP